MDEESPEDLGTALRPSEPLFRAIFNDPHVLMALLDPEGTIRHVNRTALDLVRPDETDVVGDHFWEGPWWTHSERLQDDLRRRVERAAGGEYVEFETEYYTGDDEQRLTAGFLRPVLDDDDRVVSIIASGRDITDRVHQRQRLDVLQRILRHNFRNGLNVIEGYAEEIETRLAEPPETEDRAELAAMARTIAAQATDLGASVTKIQQLERYDPGRRERIAVGTLFARVAADLRADHPDCRVTTTVPRSGVEVPTAFTTAVSEAVTNAVTHHPQSAPTIELTASVVTESDPPQVRLCVADDGPGIPPSEAEPVLSGEETALTHTSGIGLWLIRWTVERHGGDLTITSNDPRGSRIAITYPLPERAL